MHADWKRGEEAPARDGESERWVQEPSELGRLALERERVAAEREHIAEEQEELALERERLAQQLTEAVERRVERRDELEVAVERRVVRARPATRAGPGVALPGAPSIRRA